MIMLLISFGITMQLVEFFSYPDYPNKAVKIVLFLVSLAVLVFVIYAHLKITSCFYFTPEFVYDPKMRLEASPEVILEHEQTILSKPSMKMLAFIRERIQNNCIRELYMCRMYMVGYLAFETLILPLIVVSLRDNFKAQIILMVITQAAMWIITLYFRPFYSKIDNVFMIVDQFLWTLVFIIFCVLSFIIDNDEDDIINLEISDSQAAVLDNLSLTLIIFLILIQVWNPLVSVFRILYSIVLAI